MASLAVSLLFAAPDAHAGSYTVTYSGGTFSNFGDKDPYVEAYYEDGGYYGDEGGNTADDYEDVIPADVGGSGEITATFTWQADYPGDLPPACAVVEQDSDVFAASDGDGSGFLDDGFGDTASVSEPGGKQLAKTQYSVKNSPGSSFTVKCSPSADSGEVFADVGASVDYTAAAYPVIVTPSGAIKDSSGAWNILIGQGCTGFITAGPATFSNFQWSIAGDTFKSFAMGNTVATTLSPSHPYGRVNYLQASDLTGPSPQWFWKNGGNSGTPETVSCSATATINGVTVGTVTGTATVNVWLPYFYFNPNAKGVSLVGNAVPDYSLTGDIAWDGAVGTPYLFFSYYLGYGIWQYTQLCNIAVVLKDPLPWYYSNTNGSVLDAEFNYSSKEAPPSPWPADSTSSHSDPQSSGDAPDVALHYYANNTYTGTWDTYMMYQPPGGTVSWVPLEKCEWTMTCVFDLANGVYTPNPPGTLTVTSDAPSSDFPVWEDYFPDTNP